MRRLLKHGWKPDLPDFRDKSYAATHPQELLSGAQLPVRTSLRASPHMPPVYDQGDIGSCTANSSSAGMEFIHAAAGGGVGFQPSRLGLYYRTRLLEGDPDQDNGAQLRDVAKVLATEGLGYESEWPYDTTKFADPPPADYLRDAPLHKVVTYSRLTTGNDFHQCLAAGFPFVIGFTVYDSFESDAVAATGFVPMPSEDENTVGGHAVLVIGYDDAFQEPGILQGQPVYEVRNSWGADWGDAGNFWVPQAYFENPNLADDAWTFRR